jgi:RNA polymerase sigma-70 factor (ECF subfamily)
VGEAEITVLRQAFRIRQWPLKPGEPEKHKELVMQLDRSRAGRHFDPPVETTEDSALVASAAGGDVAAFETLVERHRNRVYGLALRMLNSEDDASEVVQETFISAYRNLANFRGDAQFTSWITRIAANHAKNRIKHLARRPTEGADPDDVSQLRALPDRPQPPVQARIETPDAMLEAMQTERLMQEAIANLPEDQRLLVVLRDVEEMSYQEIEEITALPEGTIKSRLHRARMAIKEWLDRHTR